MHGEFEAGPDEIEEDLEEVAGDVDDEASSVRELAEDEGVNGDAMIEREFFRNHEESNMKEKLSCEPLFSQFNSPPVLYSTIHYYTVLYSTIHYYTVLYSTIQYYTVLYSTIQYYTVLYSTSALDFPFSK